MWPVTQAGIMLYFFTMIIDPASNTEYDYAVIPARCASASVLV